jgi:hypothetical protein
MNTEKSACHTLLGKELASKGKKKKFSVGF